MLGGIEESLSCLARANMIGCDNVLSLVPATPPGKVQTQGSKRDSGTSLTLPLAGLPLKMTKVGPCSKLRRCGIRHMQPAFHQNGSRMQGIQKSQKAQMNTLDAIDYDLHTKRVGYFGRKMSSKPWQEHVVSSRLLTCSISSPVVRQAMFFHFSGMSAAFLPSFVPVTTGRLTVVRDHWRH